MTCTAGDLDDADRAEVELALEHRQRDDPDRRDQEHRREEPEQLRRLLAEQRRGDQRDDQQRDQRQDAADQQREQLGALDMRAVERRGAARARCPTPSLASDSARSPMIIATATRPNSAGGTRCASTTADADGRDLRGDPRQGRPAQALEGLLLELRARDVRGRQRVRRLGGVGQARRWCDIGPQAFSYTSFSLLRRRAARLRASVLAP